MLLAGTLLNGESGVGDCRRGLNKEAGHGAGMQRPRGPVGTRSLTYQCLPPLSPTLGGPVARHQDVRQPSQEQHEGRSQAAEARWKGEVEVRIKSHENLSTSPPGIDRENHGRLRGRRGRAPSLTAIFQLVFWLLVERGGEKQKE